MTATKVVDGSGNDTGVTLKMPSPLPAVEPEETVLWKVRRSVTNNDGRYEKVLLGVSVTRTPPYRSQFAVYVAAANVESRGQQRKNKDSNVVGDDKEEFLFRLRFEYEADVVDGAIVLMRYNIRL